MVLPASQPLSLRPSSRAARRWAALAAGTCGMLAGGTILGLMLTAAALRHGSEIGAWTAGPWQLSPQEGTPNIDPYRRAVLAGTGAIPMSAGQGIALLATRDDSGRKLDRRCSYRVGGAMPRAWFWTLGIVDAEGFAISNPAHRHAFTSSDVLRDDAGGFAIAVSPGVQPGNWLPLAGDGRFALVLRLYDSMVTGSAFRQLGAQSVPTITASGCG